MKLLSPPEKGKTDHLRPINRRRITGGIFHVLTRELSASAPVRVGLHCAQVS
jgi:hypothetical protein